jgi:hypothetical protein
MAEGIAAKSPCRKMACAVDGRMIGAALPASRLKAAESPTVGQNRSRLLRGLPPVAESGRAARQALLLTNGKSKTPACEVSATSTSDSITAFLDAGPARPIAKGTAAQTNCLQCLQVSTRRSERMEVCSGSWPANRSTA